MHLIRSSFLLASVSAALALPFQPETRNYGEESYIYFLDNNPAGSCIVSLKACEGKVYNPVRTSTGGYGLIGENATGFPDAADTLSSQSSVAVYDNYLFTVNAGSNTVAFMKINPQDPQHPTLVGTPAPSLGDIPVSVDYSPELRLACVVNGGPKAGVACFDVDDHKGLKPSNHKLISIPLNQTSPQRGPPDTVSQIVFDPASSGVHVLVKGNAMTKQPGSIYTMPIVNRRVSTDIQTTSFKNVFMEFGSVFLDSRRLLVSDPAFGASILTYHPVKYSFTQTDHTVVAAQKAICWSAYSPQYNTGYLIDAAQGIVFKIDASTGALSGDINYAPSQGQMSGGFDTAVNGKYAYVLGADAGVAVLDLETSKQASYADLSSLGSRQGWTGMATWG